ncbi:hypothetical protein Tco_1160979, partial [Tanacetum coccineum]
LWEDFVYQVKNKNVKRSNGMYYPRFTKVIVNFFMTKDQSIPRRNNVNWHFARDGYMFTMIKVVSRHEDTQLYGAILPNDLTNEAIKDYESCKEYYDIALGAKPPKTKASVKKKQARSDKAPKAPKVKRLKATAKVTKPSKKKLPTQGLETLSKVALMKEEQMRIVTKRSLTQFHSSHKSSSDEDDDAESENDDDDDDANNQDDDGQEYDVQDDDNVQTDSDNDGDNFIHPNDKEIQGANVEGEELDEEETNEEDKANELYRDVNVNLEGRDTEMADTLPRTIIQTTHCVNWQSIQDMLKPNVPVTTIAEPPLLSATILPPPPTPLITHLQQTPVPTPATVPSSSLQDLPNFAVSSIPGVIDAYLGNKMHEAIKTNVQLQSDKLRDEAQAENEDFINKLDNNIKKIIKDQFKEQVKAQTSHAVAANLSELELKKILIDKMESNKSIHRSDEQKNLYKAVVDAYKSDKLILDMYGDTVSFKRRRYDEDKDEEPSAGSNRGSKRRRAKKNQSQPVHQRKRPPRQLESLLKGPNLITRDTEDKPDEETVHHLDWFQKPAKPPTPDRDWNKTLTAAHGPVQTWLSTLAQKEDTHDSFNELMDTPLDFSAFVMNRLKATTDQLDWNNPEGQQYPHDLRKPLPLIPNSRGRQVIHFDHFINNDLAYLNGGVSSKKYTTSVRKTKHLDWTTVRRDDDKLYKFKEGDFNRLRIQDIEDMLLFLVQGKLRNLTVEERLAFNVSLRMFTRSIVIQRRVEDL